MSSRQAGPDEVTELLRAWRGGDEGADALLLERVYQTLRQIAIAQLRGERAGHTLQPTALVNEAYLRLVGQREVDWRDRSHFFGLAAMTMRRILVDHARRRTAKKRDVERESQALTIATEKGEAVDLLDLAARAPTPRRAGSRCRRVASTAALSSRSARRWRCDRESRRRWLRPWS